MDQTTPTAPLAVGAANFESAVLHASHERPVLVDFWAAWCAPCRMLAPILDRLADAYAGRADVVKIDTDAEQELAARYGVRSLPTVAVFRHGKLVDAVIGAQPEGVLRELVERHVDRPSDRERAAAVAAAAGGDVDGAVATLERLVLDEPERTPHLYALLDVLLAAGRAEAAAARLAHLPVTLEMDPEIVARKARLELVREAGVDGAHADAAKAFLRGDREAAFDRWLDLMRARETRDGAQRALRAAFALLGDHDALAVRYRRRMASLLH